MNDHAAGASPVDRPVRPAAEARWYCLDRDGVAMLCKDEADARAQVIENDDLWPARAPHRAALLFDSEYLRDGGDFIPLAQPRNEQAKRTAELCLSAWATARMDALEAKNAALAREAHTWWTAARDATAAERERCAQRVALHSQYPIQTDYDRGYDKARKDAAETLRNMSTYVLTYAPDRPSTPVGWSDTDWLKHLEEIRQNEAAYARGPLPERGWD